MNVVTRGSRNAFRNMIRTVAIVIILGLSLGLSLVMLITHQAVNDKINMVKESIGNTVDIEPPGFDSFSGVNNTLSASVLQKVKPLKHVTKLTELLANGLQTSGTEALGNINSSASTSLVSPDQLDKSSSNGTNFYSGAGYTIARPSDKALGNNVSLPVDIAGSTHPTDPVSVGSSSIKIVQGTSFDGTKDANVAMLSQSMASKNNLHVGSTFIAYSQKLTVVGIFESDTDNANNHVLVPLPTEQRLSGETGDVSSAYATVDSLDNLASTTKAIQKTLGNADVSSLQQQADQALKPLNSTKSITLYSLIGSVGTGAAILLLTMIMIVRERKREIGIIKAIGFSNLRIAIQFAAEAVTFTLMGEVIGLGIGLAGGAPITAQLVKNSSSTGSAANGFSGPQSGGGIDFLTQGVTNVHAAISWPTILYGLGVAMLIALVGSGLAAFFIAKVRPAEVLRSE